MHDIDRTQLEASWETGDSEGGDYEFEFESTSTEGAPFNEMDEMELASQLLEVSDEAELDQFLGSLFKKASRTVGSFLKGPIGQQLGGMIKPLIKQALPLAGGALGSFIPGLGTAIGTQAGSAAANMFEMELEGLSGEDQEFEVARRVVRLAGEAAQQAAQTPPSIPPQDAAKAALVAAAQQHAPGLLRQAAAPAGSGQYLSHGRSGRWVRRGRTIVLYGL